MPPRRKGFFAQEVRPEDEAARQREVAALLAPRRTIPQEIGVERIEPNPFQARQEFSGIDELAEAIRQQGFVSRLRVRPNPTRPGYFQLVFGERRLRAARLAGLTEVPCEVAEHSDEELIEIGLAENIQRRDLAPLEEAQAFQTFIDQRGYSIRRLAERIGKDKSYVEDRIKLLQTPEDVQHMVAQRPDTLRAAREIAKIATAAARAPVIAGVVEGRFNTEDVRTIVRESTETTRHTSPRTSASPSRDTHAIIERDTKTIRSILTRWRSVIDEGEDERALVAEQTEAILREVQKLVALLGK